MTNSPIASVKCRTIQPQCPVKPHALYDGTVFIAWSVGVVLLSIAFLNICKAIKTIIGIK